MLLRSLFKGKKRKASTRLFDNTSAERNVVYVVHDMKMQALADELRRNVLASQKMNRK